MLDVSFVSDSLSLAFLFRSGFFYGSSGLLFELDAGLASELSDLFFMLLVKGSLHMSIESWLVIIDLRCVAKL